MSNSITLTSTENKGSRYFELKCTQTKGTSAENSSTIKWTLSAIGDSTHYSTGPTKVIINGVTVYSEERVDWSAGKFPVAQGSTSGSLKVSHNTDGTKKITVKFSTAIYTKTVTEYSDTWTLDSISRYPTVSHSVASKTEESITMNWSSDSAISTGWYSTDNGDTWASFTTNGKKSGTYTITGLEPNTTYKVVTSLQHKENELEKDSSALSVKTYDYPHCTTTPNFVIGDKVKLTFYNPLGRTFHFYVIANGKQLSPEWTTSGTSYTGINADSTQALLYATIPNAKSCKYKIKTVWTSDLDEYTWTADNGNTISIDESKCLPTFTDFSYRDSSSIPNITGKDQELVKSLSTLTVSISDAQKMVAKNGATPSKYVISIDKLSVDMAHTKTSIDVGRISSKGVLRLNVRAYDSRGLSTLKYKDITVHDYEKPVINVEAKRLNSFEAQTTIKVDGAFSLVTMSNGWSANSITKASYWWREVGGTWSEELPLTVTVTDNKYTCSDAVRSFDNQKEFEIWVTVYDKFEKNDRSETVGVGKAIFFISTNKEKCYINRVEVPTFESIYPIDSVICTAKNENPSTTYGGTWELIDKGFKSYSVFVPSVFKAGTNVVTDSVFVARGGNSIRVRLGITVNTAMSDTGMLLGTFSWDGLGITGLHAGLIDRVAYRDGANGGFLYTLYHDSGELHQLDVIDSTSLASGNLFYLEFNIVTDHTRMLDSACDKFYWQRTS